MKLLPIRKPKKLNSKERKFLGIPWRYTERPAHWHTDSTKAERVPLCHLQNGDRFRILDKHGKPYGPRWTVVFDMDDYDAKYGTWKKYMPACSMLFTKEGHTGTFQIGHKHETIVKPLYGKSMAVLAKLNSFADHNYFPA